MVSRRVSVSFAARLPHPVNNPHPMKTTRLPSLATRRPQLRGSLSLAAAVAAVLAASPGAVAQYTGEFSAAFVGNGGSGGLSRNAVDAILDL